MSTFVLVGNAHQPFWRLLRGIEGIAHLLPQPVIVQCGHTPFHSQACKAESFLDMVEFERQIGNADLVVSHAGGGGVMLAVQAGKVPVLMPRRACHGEHVDDHQVENARELAATGKVVVAENPEDLFGAIGEAMKRQSIARRVEAIPPLVAMISEVLRRTADDLKK